jgi:hypothetical protein
MQLRLSNRIAIISLAGFSLAIFLPAIFVGIPENYDLGQHLRFAITFYDSFRNGNPFPPFGWNDNFGFGSVGVRFYPPLAHIAMGLVQLATGSWYDTLWLTMLLWMLLGLLGSYLFASEIMPRPWALTAAIIYAIVPYHLLQVFQAFFLSEFAAAAILPFCFLFLLRVLKHQSLPDTAMLGFFAALLILAHLPSAIMGAFAMGIFAASYLLFTGGYLIRRFTLITISAIASLAASSFYWVCMLPELKWVKHNTTEYYAAGYYNYATYFFPMFLSAGEDYFPRFLWMMDLTTASTVILLLPVGAAFFIGRKEAFGTDYKAILIVAISALFMASLASKPLWDSIPILQKLQFPFRWLIILSFAVSILFPAGVKIILTNQKQLTRKTAYPIAAIALIVLIFDITQIVVPSAPVPRDEIARRVTEVQNTPGCECWWPVWAKKEALSNRNEVTVADRNWVNTSKEASRREYVVASGPPAKIRFNLFYYPHWHASLNGSDVSVEPDENGAVAFDLPEKASDIILEFREPDTVIAARPVSLLMLVFLLSFAIFWRRSSANDEEDQKPNAK